MDGAFGVGEVGVAGAGVDGDGAADGAVLVALAGFALSADGAEVLEVAGGEVEAKEASGGPGEGVDEACARGPCSW